MKLYVTGAILVGLEGLEPSKLRSLKPATLPVFVHRPKFGAPGWNRTNLFWLRRPNLAQQRELIINLFIQYRPWDGNRIVVGSFHVVHASLQRTHEPDNCCQIQQQRLGRLMLPLLTL